MLWRSAVLSISHDEQRNSGRRGGSRMWEEIHLNPRMNSGMCRGHPKLHCPEILSLKWRNRSPSCCCRSQIEFSSTLCVQSLRLWKWSHIKRLIWCWSVQKAQPALIGQLSQAWAGSAHHVSASALSVFLQPRPCGGRWRYRCDITTSQMSWRLI